MGVSGVMGITVTTTSSASSAAYSGSSALLTPWDRVTSPASASSAAPTVTSRAVFQFPVLKVSVFVGLSPPSDRSVPAWPDTVTVTSPAGWEPRTTE